MSKDRIDILLLGRKNGHKLDATTKLLEIIGRKGVDVACYQVVLPPPRGIRFDLIIAGDIYCGHDYTRDQLLSEYGPMLKEGGKLLEL